MRSQSEIQYVWICHYGVWRSSVSINVNPSANLPTDRSRGSHRAIRCLVIRGAWWLYNDVRWRLDTCSQFAGTAFWILSENTIVFRAASCLCSCRWNKGRLLEAFFVLLPNARIQQLWINISTEDIGSRHPWAHTLSSTWHVITSFSDVTGEWLSEDRWRHVWKITSPQNDVNQKQFRSKSEYFGIFRYYIGPGAVIPVSALPSRPKFCWLEVYWQIFIAEWRSSQRILVYINLVFTQISLHQTKSGRICHNTNKIAMFY